MSQSKILIRGEGGLGDCLLANRFIPAIREAHPRSHITFALDNNRGERFQLSVLKHFYPSMSDRYCMIKDVLLDDFDLFYDLHIDKMSWPTYDIDWLSRFYYFPKPANLPPKQRHICLHLTHDKWPPKNLPKNYIEQMVRRLKEVTDIPLIAICTETEADSYADILDLVEVQTGSIIEACETVCSAQVFITIDSGFKYMAYGAGVPTIETSSYHDGHCRVPDIVKHRWILFPERGFPLMTHPDYFADRLESILKNPIMAA